VVQLAQSARKANVVRVRLPGRVEVHQVGLHPHAVQRSGRVAPLKRVVHNERNDPLLRIARGVSGGLVLIWRPIAESTSVASWLRPPGSPYALGGNLERWKELGAGAGGSEAEARLDRVVKEEGMMAVSPEHLHKVVTSEKRLNLSEKEYLRLSTQMASHDVKLMRDPAPKGALIKVRDAVILVVYWRDKVEDLHLVRESEPRGLFVGERRATESLAQVAERVLQEEAPPFLRDYLKVEPFKAKDGCWLATDAAIATAPEVLRDPGGNIQDFVDQAVAKVEKTGKGSYADDIARQKAEKEARSQAVLQALQAATDAHTQKQVEEGRFPAATRYFVMRAEFTEDVPGHILMQAGLGFDSKPCR